MQPLRLAASEAAKSTILAVEPAIRAQCITSVPPLANEGASGVNVRFLCDAPSTRVCWAIRCGLRDPAEK